MKDKKAAGMDGINTEIIKALDGTSLRTLTKLCNKIYSTGYIPDDMMNSVFITLPKKPKAINCTEFRTISLMSHIMKLLLRIILDRIDAKIESEIDDCQSGFRPGKGTREGIFNLRTIVERCMEEQKDVFVCFIDYEKAFDSIYNSKIMQCMETIDIDENDKRLIGNLYWNQQAAVRLESGISTLFPIKRGVRQGCVLSPKLFNLYTELIFRKSIEIKGCVVGGVNINNLRYADDTALIAENEKDLQELVYNVQVESEKMGLKMNVKKTKTMLMSRDHDRDRREGINRRVNIMVNGQKLEQVQKFKYLGQWITEDGRCNLEVKTRIEIARSAFTKLRNILTSKGLSLSLKKRLVHCYVLSTFLYASESWTLNKQIEDRINALEMWIYRRMLKVSYTDRVSNEEILRRVGGKRNLVRMIKTRKMQYFGHIVRADGMQRLLLDGKIEGVRRRGAQRRTWAKDITDWAGKDYTTCIRLASNRTNWRLLVADLLNKRDGTG